MPQRRYLDADCGDNYYPMICSSILKFGPEHDRIGNGDAGAIGSAEELYSMAGEVAEKPGSK